MKFELHIFSSHNVHLVSLRAKACGEAGILENLITVVFNFKIIVKASSTRTYTLTISSGDFEMFILRLQSDFVSVWMKISDLTSDVY